MIPSAREAYTTTTEKLKDLINPKHFGVLGERIRAAAEAGRPEVMLKKDEFDLRGESLGDISRYMRYLEVYLRANGYKVEVGYGCDTITVRWV